MTHIVIHEDSNNVTQYVEFDDVQAAAGYLEDLVNQEGDANARLFALDPVEFAVKSYVRVEIGVESDTAAVAEASPVDAAVAPDAVVTSDEAVPAEVEVFTDAPADDTVEYVEAAMTSPEPYAVGPSVPQSSDDGTGSEARRGLFGR